MDELDTTGNGSWGKDTMNAKTMIFAVIAGIAIALLTGLISNPESGIVGATHYGYPFRWLIRMVVAPEYFPWRIDFLNLVGNILIWVAITGAIFLVFERIGK